MIPVPRVPVSQQSYGQFAAPTAAPMQDAGPQQMQQLGASLLNAGASAARIGADLQADLDQGFLMESDALASELARNTVGSYRQMAGLPAIESFGDTQEQLRTKLRNLSDTARSPQQKQALERILVQRMEDASGALAAHRDVQVRNRAIGGAKAGMESEIQNYLAALGNPGDMQVARELMIQRAGELSRHRGEDGDMAKLTLLDATTRMHAGAVEALLAADRPMEALAYLEQNGGEIAPVERAQTTQKARAGFVEWGARQLDESMPDVGQRLAVVKEWEQAGRLTPTEAESARRHVMQFETMRLQADALAERKLRDDWEKWSAANPMLRAEDSPDLKARADALGVMLTREQQTVPAFEEELRRTPMEELRRLDDNQLRNRLARGLNKSDQRRWFAMVRSDQTTRKLEDDIQRVARLNGIDPKSPAMDEWRINTIDAAIAKHRDRKKDDLTDAEIRELVLAPLEEQVMVDDTFSPDNAMPLEQALRTGTDPATIYEPIKGKAPVYMTDIPPDRAAEIATAFRRKNPRGTMSFSMLAQVYDRMGRPASAMDMDKAENAAAVQAALKEAKIDLWPTFTKKSAEAAERRLGRQSVLPVPMTEEERQKAMRALAPKKQ
jgi:hypothetical protein